MSWSSRMRDYMDYDGLTEEQAVAKVQAEREAAELAQAAEDCPDEAEATQRHAMTCIDCGKPSNGHRLCDRCFIVVKR